MTDPTYVSTAEELKEAISRKAETIAITDEVLADRVRRTMEARPLTFATARGLAAMLGPRSGLSTVASASWLTPSMVSLLGFFAIAGAVLLIALRQGYDDVEWSHDSVLTGKVRLVLRRKARAEQGNGEGVKLDADGLPEQPVAGAKLASAHGAGASSSLTDRST